MKAFRDYFAEYPDQVAHDDAFEQVAPNAARSHWHLTATSATTGKKLIRKGAETIYSTPKARSSGFWWRMSEAASTSPVGRWAPQSPHS